MKKSLLSLILIFILSLFLISCGSNSVEEYRQRIMSVHDGDTFRDMNNTQYRLYSVDTPEMSNQYDGFSTTKGIEQIYAYEATEFTKNMILNKNVLVRKYATDRYGRSVARIIINGKDLSMELVKAGLARVAYIDVMPGSVYETKEYDYFRKILELQHLARINKRGFWLHEKDFSVIFPKA